MRSILTSLCPPAATLLFCLFAGAAAAGPTLGGPDSDGDGVVGLPDFFEMGREFGHTTGPSGITNAQCDPTSCRCSPQ